MNMRTKDWNYYVEVKIGNIWTRSSADEFDLLETAIEVCTKEYKNNSLSFRIRDRDRDKIICEG